MKTYSVNISKRLPTIILIAVFQLIGLGALLIFNHITDNPPLVITAIIVILAVLGVFSYDLRDKVIITDDVVALVTLLGKKREILFSEIDRINEYKNHLTLSGQNNGPIIEITDKFQNYEEIKEQIFIRFKSISPAKEKDILTDLGALSEIGIDLSATGLKATTIINTTGIILFIVSCVCCIKYKPNEPINILLQIVGIAFPLAVLGLYYRFKGEFYLGYRERAKQFQTACWGMTSGSGCVWMFSLQYDSANDSLIYTITLIGALAFIGLAVYIHQRTFIIRESILKLAFSLLLPVAAYCYGLTTLINVADKSDSTIYKTIVSKKYSVHGSKYTSYYLVLGDMGKEMPAQSWSVRLKAYSNRSIGDTVTVHVHPGYLGIAWFDKDDLE